MTILSYLLLLNSRQKVYLESLATFLRDISLTHLLAGVKKTSYLLSK